MLAQACADDAVAPAAAVENRNCRCPAAGSPSPGQRSAPVHREPTTPPPPPWNSASVPAATPARGCCLSGSRLPAAPHRDAAAARAGQRIDRRCNCEIGGETDAAGARFFRAPPLRIVLQALALERLEVVGRPPAGAWTRQRNILRRQRYAWNNHQGGNGNGFQCPASKLTGRLCGISGGMPMQGEMRSYAGSTNARAARISDNRVRSRITAVAASRASIRVGRSVQVSTSRHSGHGR